MLSVSSNPNNFIKKNIKYTLTTNTLTVAGSFGLFDKHFKACWYLFVYVYLPFRVPLSFLSGFGVERSFRCFRHKPGDRIELFKTELLVP
ncbi:unnamed protein product [Acanthoscelides obtectus]|uniref:Uncharacterized protein n=1 Tax=Acanthoscelides obtectus TaxID=200917 RepID=A0A9P0QBH3_ACAOB|nr:unnamed protein product [Acanthoscelides obtectus]CAK1630804.1 hypothetical protein AOBTE_LOCUS6564 [Acanthoscelides obtectus]